MSNGILYVCPTPIGNLEDITLRALRILKEVDLIACEDTRLTQKLLNHYEIKTATVSYHKFSEKQKTGYLAELLQSGKNIALVSDAGTPLISDPGSELLKVAAENEITVVSLPGACALTVAASSVYLEKTGFTFVGFLPKKTKEVEELLLKFRETNLILYEAPSRLIETLNIINELLDNPNVVVARELTKFYEEVKKASAQNLIEYYTKKGVKGEIVLIIEGKDDVIDFDDMMILEKAKKLKKDGFSTKDISKIISILEDVSKSRVYNLIKDL